MNIIPTTNSSKENVKKVLKQIDAALAKKGIAGHQERLLRIYKTVMAVEKHSNCFVSKFFGAGDNENDIESFRTFEEVKPSVEVHMDNETKKIQLEFEDDDPKNKNFKVNMDDLLSFVEHELGMSHSESSDDGTDTTKNDKKKTDDETKSKNREIEKKFFNIELKLRAFIRESEDYDIFSKSSFKSFVNDKRLLTPGSNKSAGKDVKSPSVFSPVSHNFFKDKEAFDINLKRHSHNHNMLKNSLNKFSLAMANRENEDTITKSSLNLKSNTKSKKAENHTQISKFNVNQEDSENEDSNTDNKSPIKHSFSINKRGSIFQDLQFKEEEIDEIMEMENQSECDEKSQISSAISEKSACSPYKDRENSVTIQK